MIFSSEKVTKFEEQLSFFDISNQKCRCQKDMGYFTNGQLLARFSHEKPITQSFFALFFHVFSMFSNFDVGAQGIKALLKLSYL